MPIDVNISTTFLGDTDTPNTYAGAGGYKVKVKEDETGLEFLEDSGGADTNIMYNDLTATADRSQNMNSKSISFVNGKQFIFNSNVAPNISESSYSVSGYGSGTNDLCFEVKNGSGQVIAYFRGDKRVDLKGALQLGNGTTSQIFLDNIISGKSLQLEASSGSFNIISFVLGTPGDVSRLNTTAEAWTMNKALRIDNNNALIYANTSGNGLKIAGNPSGNHSLQIKHNQQVFYYAPSSIDTSGLETNFFAYSIDESGSNFLIKVRDSVGTIKTVTLPMV